MQVIIFCSELATVSLLLLLVRILDATRVLVGRLRFLLRKSYPEIQEI